MKTWLIPLIVLTLALGAACTSGDGTTPTPDVEQGVKGVLEGAVTIGPLCPVEPCGDRFVSPYSGIELVLQQQGGVSLRVPIQAEGVFRAAVPVGSYTVNMSPCEYLGCESAFPLTVDIVDGETTTLNIDIDTGIRAVTRQSEADELHEALRAAGASVEVGGPMRQEFFGVPGQVLTINGTDVQVFEYAGPEEAQADAAQVAPDGSSVGLTMIMWVAPPHFYALGRLIVLYVGDDAAITLLLEGALGPPFAEGGQTMLDGTPPDGGQGEEAFSGLLTLSDVEPLLAAPVRLGIELTDFKKMAEEVDPAQVVNIDSWYGLDIGATGSGASMTFSVIDFVSPSAALEHYGTVKEGMLSMTTPIGDASAKIEVNAQGIGSMVVFIAGDRVVSLHTAQAEGAEPLVPLEGLEDLADLVASRL